MTGDIVADIGGTYARFAIYEDEKLHNIKKYPIRNFSGFIESLEVYCQDVSIQNKTSISIATAAYQDKEIWRFVNNNPWIIDPVDIKNHGWEVEIIINDFAASTRGLLACTVDDYDILKSGDDNVSNLPKCLLGPGTGLGLGYLVPLENGKHHVQLTHGGHMPAAGITDEHWQIIKAVQSLIGNNSNPVVFENLVSGPGLFNIYKALHLIEDKKLPEKTTEEFFEQIYKSDNVAALRIFHEFLALFAANAVITGHAYGGLYLTGGVLDKLVENNLFNFAVFENFFILEGVESVQRDLNSTKIVRVIDPYLAMKGLLDF